MSNVGGFRKGEIDGKPFLIYTLWTQTDDPSSSSEPTTVSGGNHEFLQPPYLCPRLRREAGVNREKNACIPIRFSPHFPTKRMPDQLVQYMLDFNSHDDICKFPVIPLFWCNNNQESAYSGYHCGLCDTSDDRGTNYYFCVTCDGKFHKECVESPSQINYPSYPFLSLQLSFYELHSLRCVCCKDPINGIAYHSPTSKFVIHPVCAMEPIPYVIDYPKRHPHPLTFFPKQAYLPCNVCGLIIESIPTYLCVPCVFVVHQDCLYFPNVIKISRHCQHRISFTSSLPSGEWSCGVCRKAVDNNYGAYSCNKCHDYFVHPRCAVRRDLWDGEELDGVPEEPEIIVPPFERIADGIILHFSHGHHLKLKTSRVDDEDKFCQACVLPIYEGNNYSCMDQCDFILHEECANAPCRKHHPLHANPLTLKVVTSEYDDNFGYFNCDACQHLCCGFIYDSGQGVWGSNLDLRCASVSEPFIYQGHEHPLFLALPREEEKSALCQICGYRPDIRKLNCIECDFIICFRCATLPYKAWYKHDKHLLTFQKEKEASDESGWCESCEKEIVYSKRGGFYSCNDYCGTTIHVDCLLGKEPYMKPGQTIRVTGNKSYILRNNTMSRPFCHSSHCGKDRCPYKVVYKTDNQTFCSVTCMYYP